MAAPQWHDTWDRVCPACSQSYTVSQSTLELENTGAVEVCPNCGHRVRVRGEFQEEAISFKVYGRS